MCPDAFWSVIPRRMKPFWTRIVLRQRHRRNPVNPSQGKTAETMTNSDKQNQMANAIRFLSMDAVEKANSGHPGLPMGAADIATTLYTRFLSHDPQNPHWPDRDRFVLSAGHGSMLLYSLLYLSGYEDITIDEIKNFRQLGSRTAGHPEYGHAAGIETTTGPLGQGIANAVGMALSERILNAQFGDSLVNHYTYVIAGDGCLMEGISQEAIALAGHLKLNKLIVFWDDNNISIDGPVTLSDNTDQPARFAASGWNTMAVDGHDQDAIAKAIELARVSEKPTLIACKTTIGFGAPNKAGTNKVHGSPLGAEEIAATRKALGWSAEPFVVPAEVLDGWRVAGLNAARSVRNGKSALPPPTRTPALNSSAGCVATCLPTSTRPSSNTKEAFRRQTEGRNPQVFGNGTGSHQRCRAGNHRRFCRSHRLEQHQDEPDQGYYAGRLRPALRPLRHP